MLDAANVSAFFQDGHAERLKRKLTTRGSYDINAVDLTGHIIGYADLFLDGRIYQIDDPGLEGVLLNLKQAATKFDVTFRDALNGMPAPGYAEDIIRSYTSIREAAQYLDCIPANGDDWDSLLKATWQQLKTLDILFSDRPGRLIRKISGHPPMIERNYAELNGLYCP